MKLKTTYMSGAGNTFTVIDNREYGFAIDELGAIAPKVCRLNETNKYQTEGLLVLNNGSDGTDFSVEFFNPDGSHDAMCGNGGRCAVKYAIVNQFFDNNTISDIFFSMAGESYKALWDNKEPALFMPPPAKIQEHILIDVNGITLRCSYVDVNSAHVVLNIKNVPGLKNKGIQETDLIKIALPIRHHQDFTPHGVNVNLFEVDDSHTLHLRTFERGVEAETGACGTGAISTAITAVLDGLCSFPVTVIPPSGIPLQIDYKGKFPGNIQNMILKGHAEITGEDIIEI